MSDWKQVVVRRTSYEIAIVTVPDSDDYMEVAETVAYKDPESVEWEPSAFYREDYQAIDTLGE